MPFLWTKVLIFQGSAHQIVWEVWVSEYYDTQELDELFQAVKGDPIELPVILAAFYGMRRSEIVGLKWNCIDFEKKTISIQHVVTDIYLDGHLV